MCVHPDHRAEWTSLVCNICNRHNVPVSMLCLLKGNLNFRNIDSWLDVLFSIFSIWQCHLQLWEKVTPKCLWFSESLYFETGWEPLHSRRRRRKLNMFYKIRNNNAPSYLCDCLLPFERNENAYNLRNQTDYSNPFTRLPDTTWGIN
jgi:hypothetical protein